VAAASAPLDQMNIEVHAAHWAAEIVDEVEVVRGLRFVRRQHNGQPGVEPQRTSPRAGCSLPGAAAAVARRRAALINSSWPSSSSRRVRLALDDSITVYLLILVSFAAGRGCHRNGDDRIVRRHQGSHKRKFFDALIRHARSLPSRESRIRSR